MRAPPASGCGWWWPRREHEPCIQDITLPPPQARALELSCLVVAAAGAPTRPSSRRPRRGEEVTRHSLSQPELTSVPGTFGDPLRVIQSLPGVARSPYGLGLLLIRGASPQDSGVYIDGHRVPLLYHFAVGPSILTPDLIDRIDFYPGGFGVRYGRATAGVVDVATRSSGHKRLHGAADVDFLDAGLSLEGPVGGGWSGGGGRPPLVHRHPAARGPRRSPTRWWPPPSTGTTRRASSREMRPAASACPCSPSAPATRWTWSAARPRPATSISAPASGFTA